MAKLIVPLKCSEVSLTWISASQINKQLKTEYEVSVSRQAINQFILYYQTTGRLVEAWVWEIFHF